MLCKDGPGCTRMMCFFAHGPLELRQPNPAELPGAEYSTEVAARRLSVSAPALGLDTSVDGMAVGVGLAGMQQPRQQQLQQQQLQQQQQIQLQMQLLQAQAQQLELIGACALPAAAGVLPPHIRPPPPPPPPPRAAVSQPADAGATAAAAAFSSSAATGAATGVVAMPVAAMSMGHAPAFDVPLQQPVPHALTLQLGLAPALAASHSPTAAVPAAPVSPSPGIARAAGQDPGSSAAALAAAAEAAQAVVDAVGAGAGQEVEPLLRDIVTRLRRLELVQQLQALQSQLERLESSSDAGSLAELTAAAASVAQAAAGVDGSGLAEPRLGLLSAGQAGGGTHSLKG